MRVLMSAIIASFLDLPNAQPNQDSSPAKADNQQE
jgi:hypothetical protein